MPNSIPSDPKPLCFVIGPIGESGSKTRKHADMLLHNIIKIAVGDRYDVVRVDEEARPGMINDVIIHNLIHADVVIADLSERNPNAFYELGIRHDTQKPTIHMVSIGTKLPFDNSGHAAIFVDLGDWWSTEKARGALCKSLNAIENPGFRVSNPITQAGATFEFRQSSDPKEEILAQILDRLSVIEGRTMIEAPSSFSEEHSRREMASAQRAADAKGRRHQVRVCFEPIPPMVRGGASEADIENAARELAARSGFDFKKIGFGPEGPSIYIDDHVWSLMSNGMTTIGLATTSCAAD